MVNVNSRSFILLIPPDTWWLILKLLGLYFLHQQRSMARGHLRSHTLPDTITIHWQLHKLYKKYSIVRFYAFKTFKVSLWPPFGTVTCYFSYFYTDLLVEKGSKTWLQESNLCWTEALTHVLTISSWPLRSFRLWNAVMWNEIFLSFIHVHAHRRVKGEIY